MNLTIACLCGNSRQEVKSCRPHLLPSDAEVDRHGSGVLFVSHLAIDRPGQNELSKLSKYSFQDGTRFFCGNCGCHLFQTITTSAALAPLAQSLGGSLPPAALADTREFFAVATGVITESPNEEGEIHRGRAPKDDTRDGGLVPWLPVAEMKGRTQKTEAKAPSKSSCDSVSAVCGCGDVQLLIQRPQHLLGSDNVGRKGAELPYSPYPDLMFPYKSTAKEKVDNPSEDKWFLRNTGEDTRYLAGTCACKSCRLVTGYEIQTWAFIPRVAISIRVAQKSASIETEVNPPTKHELQATDSYITLDFEELANLPAGRNPLRSYESSPGVFREFCHVCGATVFWHSKVRPDLIDVSVGLLQASEGARAESLLEWWRGRCSFAEDAGLDRTGWIKDWAEGLIQGLEHGMKQK